MVLDLLLQCCHWISLHNFLGWLGCDLHVLAEDVPHSCFGGWLRLNLDAAQARDRKYTCLLHLLRGMATKLLITSEHFLVFKLFSVANAFTRAPLLIALAAPAFIDFIGGNMVLDNVGIQWIKQEGSIARL